MTRTIPLAILLAMLTAVPMTWAQEPPPPPDRGGPDRGGPAEGRGGRGAPVPPEQRLLQQIAVLLGSDEAEWQILGPRIQEIQLLVKQRERFSKPKPPPPPRPPARDGEPPHPPEPNRDPNLIVDLGPDPNRDINSSTAAGVVAKVYNQLVKLASYPNISQGDLSAGLAAFRQARAESDRELAAAREDLRKLVTTRQELVLVVMGILD